jgi:macrolide-specific efflux system membrane fusion protein
MRRVWRRTNPWTKVASVAVVLALAGVGVWWFGFRGDPASAAAPVTRTVQAATTTMEKTVSASGTVAPSVEEDVSFAVSGTVTSVPVTQGKTVTKGQVLATVGTLQLKADLLSAEADLASAKATLSDAQDASDGTDASDARIAAAQSQVDVAQAAVDSAQDAYDASTLKAPVAGLLTSVNVAVGDTVTGSSGSSSGSGGTSGSGGSGGSGASGFGGSSSSSTSSSSSAQFVIVGTDSWEVAVTVSDSDVANVKVGNQAEITIDDVADTIYGTVSEIGLLSTSSSGVAAYPVTIAVTPGQDTLHDGESADVSIIYSKRTDVLAVPSLAVSTGTDGASYVTKVDAEGKETKTVVKTGETANQMTEITSGLSEGDSVVLVSFTPGGGSGSGNTQRGQRGEGGYGFGGGLPGGGAGDFPGGFPGSGQNGGGQYRGGSGNGGGRG